MHRRTKEVAIPSSVRQAVEDRDGHCCIFCGSPNARGEAHVINRSQGGLGVEQNLVTVCPKCHSQMDNGQASKLFKEKAQNYLKAFYKDYDPKDYVFDKWK